MENLKKVLAERQVVAELGSREHEAVLEGCEIVSDRLIVRIDTKGRYACPGFEQIGYDPGMYACPWSAEAAENYGEYLPDEYYALYTVYNCVRETVIQMDGFRLTLRSHV